MRLTGVKGGLISTTTVVRARASVSIALLPAVEASSVVLLAGADYNLLAASPELTTSGLYKYKPNSVVTEEELVFTVAKSLTDEAITLEFIGLSTNKPTQNSVSTSDTQVLSPQLGKYDTYDIFDASLVLQFDKDLADAFALNDSAESFDGLVVISAKSVSNVVFATEILQRGVVKSPTEEQVVLSSGSLRAQNYCDFTYFAEDYVGESRIF